MKRFTIKKRDNWEQKVEELSFEFHSLDNAYWDEGVFYSFTMSEINELEKASNELFKMCLDAVQYVIDNNLYNKFHINPELVPLIERSWENEEASVYGRFDLSYDGISPPKLLEFNADTPTSLYEAAVVQWYWLQEVFKQNDQFNSIHEALVGYWKGCTEYFDGGTVYFSCIKDTIEDFTTVEYLRSTADEAGLNTKFIYIDEIGWDNNENVFIDLQNEEIKYIFKLYPYEWLIEEPFGKNILKDENASQWIEPAWKSILSNKAILPILYKLFPNSPYLLPSYFEEEYPGGLDNRVRKPIYSREGANTSIYINNVLEEENEGEYGEERYIIQEYVELFNLHGNNAVIGSWIIGGESVGIGVRESENLITNNVSRFVPHLIDKNGL